MERWIVALCAATCIECGTADSDATRSGLPDGGVPSSDGGGAESNDPSCITALLRCWDIGGSCAWADRTWMGEEVGAICYATGACQLGPLEDGSHIMLASDGQPCFREYDPAADASCAIGRCTYRYDSPDGAYVVQEARDEHGAVVVRAECPTGTDAKAIPEREYYGALQWQEDAIVACTRSLDGR